MQIIEQAPLQNDEAEQTLIGIVLEDSSVLIDIANRVDHEDFCSNAHKEIFEAIEALAAEGTRIDIITLVEKLKARKTLEACGGRSYIVELLNRVVSSANAVQYADMIRAYAQRRYLISSMTELQAELFDRNKSISDLQDLASNKVDECLKSIDKKNYGEKLARSTMGDAIELFKSKFKTGESPVIIPTGFSSLDPFLNGGLRAGLYSLGAVSGLGKTSLAIQIADNIAKSGKTVLFVSLEMSKEELTAKIISRLTYERVLEEGITYSSINLAKNTADILNTHKYKDYDEETRRIIDGAVHDLELRGRKLIIYEGMGNVGVKDITSLVKSVKRIQGEAPVVIVDYLQILAPADIRATDKQNTDKAILGLKILSREENTPVLVISSFNRDSYKEPVSLTSFKETGAIEYTSDVVLGLQYEGMDYEDGETPKSADRNERVSKIINTAKRNGHNKKMASLELKVLKNRNGDAGDRVRLSFAPYFNYFTEPSEWEED